MLSRITSALVSIFILMTACCACLGVSDGQVRAGSKNIPAQQMKFCEAWGPPNAAYKRLMKARESEMNPIKKEAIQNELNEIDPKFWKVLYALMGPSGEFKDWRGKLEFRRRNDNDGVRDFNPNRPVHPEQFTAFVTVCENRSIGTGSEATFILAASPMGQTLASFDMTKDAIVSGAFIFSNAPNRITPFLDAAPGAGIGFRFAGPLLVRFTSLVQAR